MSSLRECGWPGYAIVLLGVVALVIAAVALMLAFVGRSDSVRTGVALLALMLSLAPVALGAFGVMLGRAQTNHATEVGNPIDPSQIERIRAEGYSEAQACLSLGLLGGAVPFLLSAVACGFSFMRPARAASSTESESGFLRT